MIVVLTVLVVAAALVLVGGMLLASRAARLVSHLRVLLALELFGMVSLGIAIGIILFLADKA
ncbi:MAG: hypothetical protein HY676_04185 [Chloroflexi bacterium]|nr:hypothetical protein [Chloroflexota bacterium]